MRHYTSDGLGSGTVSVIHIVDALYDSAPGDLIVLDEPELSLHPAAQRRLASLLVKLSADRQIVVATHSPYLAPLEHLGSGMTVARVYATKSGARIGQLQPITIEPLAKYITDRNNPHVLGLDAREVLFLEDNVILVEGQEDVVHYRKLLTPLSGSLTPSFYGWGVGGASKMQAIAAALRDLGISRILGILDADNVDTAAELSKIFPEYRFETIPAKDVRTKPARTARSQVLGLITEEGTLDPQYSQYMQDLRDIVGNYFSTNDS